MTPGAALDRITRLLNSQTEAERLAILQGLLSLFGIEVEREYERIRKARYRAGHVRDNVRDTSTTNVRDKHQQMSGTKRRRNVRDTPVVILDSPALDSPVVPASTTKPLQKETGVLLEIYEAGFVKKHGVKPLISRPKDWVNLSKIVRQFGLEKSQELIQKFFDSDDEFVQKAGHGIGVFLTVVNKLLVADNGYPLFSRKTAGNIASTREALRILGVKDP